MRLVSIILSVPTCGTSFTRSVRSIQQQDSPYWELLILCNSVTFSEVNSWLAEMLLSVQPNIRVLCLSTNEASSVVRNIGVSLAIGDIVTWLGVNEMFGPDHVNNILRHVSDHNIVLYSHNTLFAGYSGEDKYATWDPSRYKHLLFMKNPTLPFAIAHSKTLWVDLGGFNELLWDREFWDFLKRAARLGVELSYRPQRCGIHEYNKTRGVAKEPTESQRLALMYNYESSLPLFGDKPAVELSHRRNRLLFASSECILDAHNAVTPIVKDVLSTLASQGFYCYLATAAKFNAKQHVDITSILTELNMEFIESTSDSNGTVATSVSTSWNDMSLTIWPTMSSLPCKYKTDDELRALSLAVTAMLLENRPDVMLTHSDWLARDPLSEVLIRSAKRLDIPVAYLLTECRECNVLDFQDVDICIAVDYKVKAYYWERYGLVSRLCDFTRDNDYGLRGLTPQAGPPIIPKARTQDSTHPGQGSEDEVDRVKRDSIKSSNKVPTIDDYDLIKEIGHGSMGIVFQALHRPKQTMVALKAIGQRKRHKRGYKNMFNKEINIVRKLNHRNIVPVLEAGESNGNLFYTMNFIEGITLDGLLRDLESTLSSCADEAHWRAFDELLAESREKRGHACASKNSAPLCKKQLQNKDVGDGSSRCQEPQFLCNSSFVNIVAANGSSEYGVHAAITLVVQIAIQCAEALSYAHAQKVIHRDIKPSNILVDALGNVFVADFGIAKLNDNDISSTHIEAMMGTNKYAAPEQWSGSATFQSDIYSLGMTIYDFLLLIGCHYPVCKPLENIVLRCVATSVAARPADAGVLVEELRRVQLQLTERNDVILLRNNGAPAAKVMMENVTSERREWEKRVIIGNSVDFSKKERVLRQGIRFGRKR